MNDEQKDYIILSPIERKRCIYVSNNIIQHIDNLTKFIETLRTQPK